MNTKIYKNSYKYNLKMSKKLLLLLFIFCCQFYTAKAQYVTIPDANFVTWLTQQYPSCMNGNQMDTTCTQIVNEASVWVNNLSINDLTGIRYFDNLQYLYCYNNQISSLPTLPSGLVTLNCDHNQLTNLTGLPMSLENLNCKNNELATLTSLPSSLKSIQCDSNQLTVISIPPMLEQLSCGQNLLVSLPALPTTLNMLICDQNQLTSLPTLPSSLYTLSCYQNQLTSLPSLPSLLFFLNCFQNQLTNIPTLPTIYLQFFLCGFNPLSSIPTLPYGLKQFECTGLQLTSLPALPNTLTILQCDSNLLTSLPVLPDSLTELRCAKNQLITLPNMPDSLKYLDCSQNQLTALPQLPQLDYFDCSHNQISILPTMINTMDGYFVNDNNISCLAHLPAASNGNISNNPLTCVPNQTSYTTGYQLCIANDPLLNPYNCDNISISGYVYSDQNANCSYDTSDLQTNNIPVKLFDSQNNFITMTYSLNGSYNFNALPIGNYQVKIETNGLPYSIGCGQSGTQSISLNTVSQSFTGINFSIDCNVTDLPIQVNTSGWVFPGQFHTLNTNILSNANLYNLYCGSATYSGLVAITVTGPVTYFSSAIGALTPSVNGNVYTYNIADFNSLNVNSLGLIFTTDTTAQANDQICVNVEVSSIPIDVDSTNNIYNFCYQVVNSYDPNMKEVYPVNVLPGYDDWFTYTIHFQNTGNAPAFNIRLRDTLDNNLDLSSFEMLGYSHPAIISMNGNILTIRFNNIMLPDSTTDYEGSLGYFQYRLKPLQNLPVGTQIENTAYIYFDYNAPIITNTTQNNFQIVTDLNSISNNQSDFLIYPNPSNGIFNFKDTKNIKQVEVYNLLGEQILAQGNQKQINLSGFAKGIYYARINGEVVVKLVKE
jgi:uncharacterized repeat protein (TIGR01451 family)